MNLDERIRAFDKLGEILNGFILDDSSGFYPALQLAVSKSLRENPWFTIDNQLFAIHSIGDILRKNLLEGWTLEYRTVFNHAKSKRVALVMAGNIPLVGFHDVLSVLISGHSVVARVSKDDPFLLPAVLDILTEIEPRFKPFIHLVDGKLPVFDAVIATGSNNSASHFEYYFSRYPHIIRHHRNAVAVLSGEEKPDEINALADDIMRYFGLGCRNVSKLFVPEKYDFSSLIISLDPYLHYLNHHKYRNNFDYNRSMYLLNQVPFLEGGALLITEDAEISSRISVLHYEYFNDKQSVISNIDGHESEIQCVVSTLPLTRWHVKPGFAQKPGLTDYADHVDVFKFLEELSH